MVFDNITDITASVSDFLLRSVKYMYEYMAVCSRHRMHVNII